MIDSYVGRRIRLRRNLLGISQDNLARNLGLTFQQIQKYEKGTNRVSASRLFLLAHLFGVSVDYFFKGPDGEDLREILDMQNLPATLPQNHLNGDDPLSGREAMSALRAFCRIKNPRVRKRAAELLAALGDNGDEELRVPPSEGRAPENRA